MHSPQRNILICPLNWGLGHASRCIPLIKLLIELKRRVIIASDGASLDLLRREFPDLDSFSLPPYKIKYSENGRLSIEMLIQLPGLIRSARREKKVLEEFIDKYKIDLVISDNRFGLWSKEIPCVYMTHQLTVKFPAWFKSFEPVGKSLHKLVINRFTECWIPDFEGEMNLSGELSHGFPPPRNACFIGPLSRFSRIVGVEREWDLLVILSGPEPQRTVFEGVVRSQLKSLSIKTLIVRGIPNSLQAWDRNGEVTSVNFLTAGELNRAVHSSDKIIVRAGYSSIMDLAAIGKNAILVPTPGQTEQEYLADYFLGKHLFYSERQEGFDLSRSIENSGEYPGLKLTEDQAGSFKEKVGERLELLLK